jgi:streptomycin 6-kinase
MFDDYLTRWQLIADGDAIVTRASRLLPVRQAGVPTMLKVALSAEEKAGGALMVWWDGDGAARVLARDGDAILLERAENQSSLTSLAQTGHDDLASRIICAAVAALHAPRTKPLPELVPLPRLFDGLERAASAHGGILVQSAATARVLLAAPKDVVALHGDIHHGNILDFGARGWLAIDPKGVLGERGFDYANIFCNPDHETATAPGRFTRRIKVVADAARLEYVRLTQWVLAWAGLSAAWHIADATCPETAFEAAKLAAARLRD